MGSIKDVCRVCLKLDINSNSLFDEVELETYIKLAEIFKKVTNVEILDREDETKPSRLCETCTSRLLGAYEFMCSVEKAEVEIDMYLYQTAGQEVKKRNVIVTATTVTATSEEVVRLEEDEVTTAAEIEVNDDMETQDLEILDDEFQTENDESSQHQQVGTTPATDTVEKDISEIYVQTITSQDAVTIIKSPHVISADWDEEEEKKSKSIGSRLQKRLASGFYTCGDCNRRFAKLETLERHKKQAHTFLASEELANISPQLNAMMNDDKSIQCQYCPRIFVRKDNYIRHLMSSHGDVAEITPEDRELAKAKHNYKKGLCPHCGGSFSQASLIIHIRRHTGENPYKCDECMKAFPRRQDLVIHQRQHTGERPHVCAACGKSFARANKLARHMRIHTGERPYKCTKCTRSFVQSNDLKIHMRRHTGEKPYKCNVCTESFICGAALRRHRRLLGHHSPEDDQDDPLINWRVSTRKARVDVKVEEQELEDASSYGDVTVEGHFEDTNEDEDYKIADRDIEEDEEGEDGI